MKTWKALANDMQVYAIKFKQIQTQVGCTVEKHTNYQSPVSNSSELSRHRSTPCCYCKWHYIL
jgi:hypothetical protein